MTFIQHAETKYHDESTAAFMRFDRDGSGHIDKIELSAALSELHVSPMSQVLNEILDEVIGEDRESEEIDLAQFKELMHLLQLREGFSKQDHSGLAHLNMYNNFAGSELVSTISSLVVKRFWL